MNAKKQKQPKPIEPQYPRAVFPLHWPAGRSRTPARERSETTFEASYEYAYNHLLNELEALGAERITFSSDVPLASDGETPDPKVADRGKVDPAVAVYFEVSGVPYAIGSDHFDTARGCIRALGLTLQGQRAGLRYGCVTASQVIEGFRQLPAPGAHASCLAMNGMVMPIDVEFEERS